MHTIIIDKREKLPYSFSTKYNTRIETLGTGDYTIDGYKTKFCIERKSLEDFVNSITTESIRFFKEIERMKSFEFSCIVVEGLLRDIIEKKYSNNYRPDEVLIIAADIFVKHGIPIVFCETRQHAIYFTEKLIDVYLGDIPVKDKKTKKANGKTKRYDQTKLL